MVNKYLGKTIDIHSGGVDLVFPHHENEIAQSECANGCTFANYWMHNGFIKVNNEKMSKSLNNFFTVRDIAKEYDYEVIRFFMLSAHYRSPINFSDELMEAAKSSLERIYNCLDNLKFLAKNAPEGEIDEEIKSAMESYKAKFIEAMEDDLNTADAISAVFEAVRYINSKDGMNKETLAFAEGLISELGKVLGLLQNRQEDNLEEEIEKLIEERQEARKSKNFARADEIRDYLKEKGIVLEDTPQGVKWRKM